MTNYIDEYKKLHKEANWFGSGACMYIDEVCLILDELKPRTVLDYGCGKANLIKELIQRYPAIEFYGYDPAIEGRDTLPIEKADLVINTDVLEHIPQDCLDEVLAKISSISDNAFFGLHHAKAYTILPNGENAHCTIKPPIWYYELFKKYYKNPYPLKGRLAELSVMITFSPSIDFLRKYEQLVNPKVEQVIIENNKILPYRIGKFISMFIPKKKNRKHFREKYVMKKG